MSGILKKAKNHKRKLLLIAVLAVAEVVCLLLGWYIIGCLVIFLVILNEAVLYKMRKERAPFDSRSRVRNVDYLVIGDLCRIQEIVPDGMTYVKITSPGRSLAASYEILRHTFSILKETGGTVAIIGKESTTGYAVFDVPYFHQVTIERLRLERLNRWKSLPILAVPIKSLGFIFGVGHSVQETVCSNENVAAFCRDREIQLRFYSIK